MDLKKVACLRRVTKHKRKSLLPSPDIKDRPTTIKAFKDTTRPTNQPSDSTPSQPNKIKPAILA
jgi:hypothetical protein